MTPKPSDGIPIDAVSYTGCRKLANFAVAKPAAHPRRSSNGGGAAEDAGAGREWDIRFFGIMAMGRGGRGDETTAAGET